MNLYTILGAAVMNEDFARDLFHDPYAALRSLNIVLTNAEFAVLQDMLRRGEDNGLPMLFMELRGRICPPGMVCPWLISKPKPHSTNEVAA
jgi:hypothetical protein